MISLDTNLIFSAFDQKDTNHLRAIAALNVYSTESFCICPIVYTELRASKVWAGLELWQRLQGIEVLWKMPESIWDLAGIGYGQYATLRKAGALSRRIAADFLIASHAVYHGLDVLTFDETVFKAVFPQVSLRPIA
jgi:predicted nucleic acid-binding protein